MKNMLIYLVAAMLVLAWALWPRAEPEKELIPVKVETGDTLFRICSKLATEHGDKRDIREIIYYARKHNDLEGKKYIYAGDRLVIEIEKGR